MLRRPSRLRSFALWLALAGVLLRGLVPAGFMPGWTQADAEGARSWLMICPAGDLAALLPQSSSSGPAHHHQHGGDGDGGMSMDMPDMAGMQAMHDGHAMSGMEHLGHRIGEAHLGCPFAGAATPALPFSLAALALPQGALAFIGAVLPPSRLSRPTLRLPPVRGPPSVPVI